VWPLPPSARTRLSVAIRATTRQSAVNLASPGWPTSWSRSTSSLCRVPNGPSARLRTPHWHSTRPAHPSRPHDLQTEPRHHRLRLASYQGLRTTHLLPSGHGCLHGRFDPPRLTCTPCNTDRSIKRNDRDAEFTSVTALTRCAQRSSPPSWVGRQPPNHEVCTHLDATSKTIVVSLATAAGGPRGPTNTT
jgi:hypothetical protein